MAQPKDQVWAVGRRKSAVARVRIVPGTGKITINKRDFADYFPTETVRSYVTQPLMIAGLTEAYDIHTTLAGGGSAGQAGAMRHGIARALQRDKAELRSVLKESGMLTRDSREKERKKPGQPGARKRFQFSKR